ncbi:MAG: long-chain-acyl-CoA synthetase [Pseudomonadota bacterium]|nr:long-chain-acyl-CoA synthetase [Pseudomonadota bacterium]
MGLVDVLSTLKRVPTLLQLKRAMAPTPDETTGSFAAWVEANASSLPEHCAIVFEEQEVNWQEFNGLANQYANYLKSRGINRGDCVSLMMDNRIEFLALIVALNKIGAIGGLINNNLTGRQLAHCISVTHSRLCIFGAEVADAVNSVRSDLPLAEGDDYYVVPDGDHRPSLNWAQDLAAQSTHASDENPGDSANNTIGETALYIFTSGTTGLPKAALTSNRRYIMAGGLSGQAGLKLKPSDRIYLCLPLYHATGLLIGAGAAFSTGASMFVRRRFSASNFLSDVRTHQCTGFVYIGELCRYLANTQEKPTDHNNPIRSMIGNGMRPDVWLDFKKRFAIKNICEFYGASEGNVSFANLFNKDCTVGMTSSVVRLVKYDVDADEIVRDADGFCVEVDEGDPGLMLGQINEEAKFDGYTDREASEKKVVRNAFVEGDAWFNSGDLMCTVKVGYTLGYPHYQFVDRVGDTFRWKSENVSTNEVGEIINGFNQVKFCNVFGVAIPGTDGRAGMAAITLHADVDAFDLQGFSAYVHRELPSYAIPVFLRIQPDIEVTGTFKMIKGDLRKEGFQLGQVDDPIYVLRPGLSEYELFDNPYLDLINKGEAGF